METDKQGNILCQINFQNNRVKNMLTQRLTKKFHQIVMNFA